MKHTAIAPTVDSQPPTITIDPEFQARIVPLSPDERKQLEENLQRDGCRDPLVVWNGVLLDGHHRHAICEKLQIKYTTVAINFTTREAALEWIDTNQLGRRNLTPEQMSLVRGRVYNRMKAAHGGARRASPQSEDLKTSERLAQSQRVSRATIERDGQFAEAVDTLKPVVPDINQRVMTGQVPSKAAVVEAARDLNRAAEILTKKTAPPKPMATRTPDAESLDDTLTRLRKTVEKYVADVEQLAIVPGLSAPQLATILARWDDWRKRLKGCAPTPATRPPARAQAPHAEQALR